MYRGQPTPPPSCHHCKGTGKIRGEGPWSSYDCTSCNGTGIAGDPGALIIILLIWFALLTIGGAIWFFSK